MLADIDHQLFYLINHLPHNQISDLFFLWVHILTLGYIFILIIILNLLHYKDLRYLRLGIQLTLGLALAVISTQIAKEFWLHPRPFLVFDDVYLIGEISGYSFPSGQSAAAACFLAIYLWNKQPKWQILSITILALLTFFDRIYTGHHYPSDVLVGMFFGFGSASVAVYTVNHLWNLFKNRNQI